MFETLVSTDRALARHRDGPLAAQRNLYLLHCADQGGTRESLRLRARSILWVAEHMSPNDFGKVDASRLHEIVYGSVSLATPAPTTAATLVSFARPWLKYLGWWPQVEDCIPFAPALENFVAWMRDERGLTRLRRTYAPLMAATEWKEAFDLLTSEAERGIIDYRRVGEKIKQVQDFQTFMSEWQKRVKTKGLSSIN